MNIVPLRMTDGTDTLNFSRSVQIIVTQYQSGAATDGAVSVEDSIQLALIGDPAVNLNHKNMINLWFVQARNYRKARQGPRIYIEADLDRNSIYWRSEILDGNIISSDEMINSEFQFPYLQVVMRVTRRLGWDGLRTQLPLSNLTASLDTSGITVKNSSHQIEPTRLIGWDDGSVIGWEDGSVLAWGDPVTGAENFVDIAGADILGDLPASIEIEIENNTSDSVANKEFYLFHNVYSNPSDFNHMLEAEAADGDTVTVSSDADCQGGSKATLAWTGTTETLIATYAISSELATQAAGGRFIALARWLGAFPYTDMFLRLRQLTSNDGELWEGALTLIKSDRELAQLDVFRLPAALENQPDIKDIKLALYGYRNHSGTHSIAVDYLQISPISGDGGWKYFISRDDGIAYGEKLVHDAIEGRNYRVDTDGKKSWEFTSLGGPILLVPGQDQRIYINECDKDGAAKIDQSWIVKLYYRPRRSSL